MKKKQENQRIDVYARITDRLVEDLARGVRPWMQPWHASHSEGRITRPLRHNGLPYSGMNVLLLWSEGMARGFTSPMWMTFKQALELGAVVRKGESGSTVVFASRFTKAEAESYLSAQKASLDSPNVALDLRIPGFFNYTEVLEIELSKALAGEEEPQAALDNIAAEWNKITDEFGRDKQLAAYRSAMGLPPLK